ncbi:CHAT domain-containing protein [Corallococcus sp. bb12-1]|uniref:CHAT domain-containing protein n=1 Tax=Corallococcus sp. bb12-1 TaxID=2996784 RepID=UPI0022703661|nr:CHAT domain-containing protein [Corallococcus sp. bb12-1]MCY1040640.1 CHAT domain-containing protein [Corallococcus sp. bb12-1]
MSTPCDQLSRFADGDLPLEESQEFARHLAQCEKCQEALTGILQLDQMGRRFIERHGPVEILWHVVPRNRWRVAALAAACAVVGLLLVLRVPGAGSLREEPSLWAGTQRTLDARVTYPAADRYRRPSQVMMGEEAAPRVPGALRQVLTELDNRGDLTQLAAAYLAGGNPEPLNAIPSLEQMLQAQKGDAADVLSDLGAAHYAAAKSQSGVVALRELREALGLLNQALMRNPGHVQALWNRALVHRQLGLPLLAMQSFAEVERRETDLGWLREARERKDRLSGALTRKKRWRAADDAGDALARNMPGAMAGALEYADMPQMRRDFYHAVRTRISREEVLALNPLAEALDQGSGTSTVLVDYVQEVSGHDFSRRAPLALDYARLLNLSPGNPERDALLQKLSNAAEKDIALGALLLEDWPADSNAVDTLIRRATGNNDPWFSVLALQTEAKRFWRRDRYDLALPKLEEALRQCAQSNLTYRCIEVRNDLAHVTAWLFRLDEAETHAREGLALAQLRGQWNQERMLLETLGNVSRNAADVVLAHAYFEEALLMQGGNPSARNVHQNFAHLAIQSLDLDEARSELEQSMALGRLTLHGVAALVDVARTRRAPGDEPMVRAVLDAEKTYTAGQRAFVKFLRGRFLLEVDPDAGREWLSQAITEATSAEVAARAEDWTDITAQHARAYSFTSLIFDDAHRGDFESALTRFGAERGFEPPDRCVLGLTEDTERSLLVARGANGQMLQVYTPVRAARFPAAGMGDVVPRDMLEALAPCATVDVLARPPLQGRAGLLPATMAWRYRTLATARQPPQGRRTHLVVNDVRYDDRRNEASLKWTANIAPDEDGRFLKGMDATPGSVLAQMPDAGEIDLATHGKVAPGSRATYLLLAPGADGVDTLFEERIRKVKLLKAPLVILAACEAARGTAALHEPGSLPNAFLAAGARGVVAATQNIPDEDSSEFFGSVRDHVRSGASLSAAVRDVRLQWLKRSGASGWVNGVLVFE